MPIVVLSAFCDRELVLNAERQNILMYLVKPVSLVHLEAALACCHSARVPKPVCGFDVDEQTELRNEFGQPLCTSPIARAVHPIDSSRYQRSPLVRAAGLCQAIYAIRNPNAGTEPQPKFFSPRKSYRSHILTQLPKSPAVATTASAQHSFRSRSIRLD